MEGMVKTTENNNILPDLLRVIGWGFVVVIYLIKVKGLLRFSGRHALTSPLKVEIALWLIPCADSRSVIQLPLRPLRQRITLAGGSY